MVETGKSGEVEHKTDRLVFDAKMHSGIADKSLDNYILCSFHLG